MLFRFFVRKNYEGIEISNEECDGINDMFAKYLHDLDLTDKQKEKILPKSEFDVMLNMTHPLRMNGFEAAYVYHFGTFVEKNYRKNNEKSSC